jgi:hypothetical protein
VTEEIIDKLGNKKIITRKILVDGSIEETVENADTGEKTIVKRKKDLAGYDALKYLYI